MSLKDSISTPLEAGTSILDTHNLPSNLNDALEYASRRLARKSLHVPLVAIRRDPHTPEPALSPPASPLPPVGPRTGFAASLRQRLNPILTTFSLSTSREGSVRSAATSPTCSVGSAASGWSRPSWPCTPATPATPATPMSVPPMTPSTGSSVVDAGPVTPGPCGFHLVHGDALAPRDEQTVRDVIDKARKKFRMGTDWLPPPVPPSAHSLPDGPIRNSLLQNDILFSSEGLTLYSLDRLYSFKSALSTYSRARSPARLEDAVDELRRLYLASGGRRVTRGDILRSYDWLGVSEAALAEVDRMYRRAYGGADGAGAIQGLKVVEEEVSVEIEGELLDALDLKMEEAGLPMVLFPNSPIETLTPLCRAPALRLQTTFDDPGRSPAGGGRPADDEEDEDLTARPERQRNLWSASIDEVLAPPEVKRLRPGSGRSERLGPTTPRGYEDISPVTRGEWGFLFSDANFGVRTAAVETC